MRQVNLGPLDAVVLEASEPAAEPLWVVLLHGFGAPGTDLVGLSQALSLPSATFVYPAALHPLGGPFAPGGGRAWWPIDFVALDAAKHRRDVLGIERDKPAGLDDARAALAEALAVLQRDHGMDPKRLVLGGFSQGAMLACDFAVRSDLPLCGLVLLSGMPVALEEWRPLLHRRQGLPVFQSHSPDDAVLPFELAERLAAALSEAGLAVTFVPFRGGHGIPLPITLGMRAFLRALSDGPSG